MASRVFPLQFVRPDKRVLFAAVVVATALTGRAQGQIQQLTGVYDAHDPSTITDDAGTYYYFSTGQGIISHTSTNLTQWKSGAAVFSTQPAWTSTAVPGFTGFFWAPDLIFQNNQYYLYYAVSGFGSQVSAIGLATNPTLNPQSSNYAWTDQGPIIQSNSSAAYNTIDPSLLQDSDGSLWMSFGSYFGGIYESQLNPTTGKLLNSNAPTQIATNYQGNSNNYFDGIEASYLLKHDGYYYLFENWGACCSGVSSTYNIRVGRSTSINGPFLDESGVSLDASGSGRGGSLFLGNDGNQIGPGQISVFSNGTQQEIGYHYYDGNNNGAPEEGIRDLFWTANDWPTIAQVNSGWNGSTDGNWSTAANWSNGGVNTVPNAAGNIANFLSTTSGQHTVTLDGGAKTAATVNFNSSTSFTIGSAGGNGLILDTGNTDNATINVQLGSHSILAPITAKETLGINITPSTSALTLGAVSGVGLNQYGFGTLNLTGVNSYTSNIFVHTGTLVVTGSVTASTFNSVGEVAGDSATLTVSSAGTFTSAGDLNIGDTGTSGTTATGVLNLSGTAQITVNSGGGFFVGSGFYSNTEADGTVFQRGGTLTANGNFDGAFVIGGRTSNLAIGIYNLSAGTVNANTDVWDGGYGNGTMNQTGGTFQAADGLSIGRETGSTGIWNISAGVLNQTGSSTFALGQSGTGTLNLSGTGQITAAAALKLGASGGTGTLNLNGGLLLVPALQQGTGTANINFSGGTLQASGNSTTFLPINATAKVKSGGAIIDSNSFGIAITTPLLHDSSLGTTADGGLTKAGLGTLTLQGVNSYTGPTAVSTGTLALAAGGSLASTSVTVANQATLTAGGASNDGLATTTALNVSGTATFAAGALNGGITKPTLSSLTLNAGGTVQLLKPASYDDRQVLITSALTFGNTNNTWQGSLDMTGNDMIVKGGNIANIQSQLTAGYNSPGGYWNAASGIISSAAAEDTGFLTTLGYQQSNGSPFDGVNTTTSDVLIKYTYYGDANLDGVINGADYQQIDQGYGSRNSAMPLTGWQYGDFNYDGVIDGSDYALIDNAFNQLTATGGTPMAIVASSTAMIAGTMSVPEPATFGLLGVGAMGLLLHRRRRNS